MQPRVPLLSTVKILEIMKFGDICEDEDMDKMMEQVEYFLETMPNLEQLIIHYETSIDEDVVEVLSQFQMVSREGLSKCKIQVISDNLNLSSTYSIVLVSWVGIGFTHASFYRFKAMSVSRRL